jgi:hypothetical protein
MTSLTQQINITVSPEFAAEVGELADRHGWSKVKTFMLGVRTLAAVMDAHERYAAEQDDDIAELYLRLAEEMPSGFLEVPKDGIRVGRAAGMPAVMIDNAWLVFPDPESGMLLAEEQGGEKRIARVIEGEIKPLKLPTAGEVALN